MLVWIDSLMVRVCCTNDDEGHASESYIIYDFVFDWVLLPNGCLADFFHRGCLEFRMYRV